MIFILYLLGTKNVSRATRKRITTRKIHVLTARVATSRKLLHALQCELDERRNDLGELMNEEMQDGSGGGHKDDADLSRAKLETQVSFCDGECWDAILCRASCNGGLVGAYLSLYTHRLFDSSCHSLWDLRCLLCNSQSRK